MSHKERKNEMKKLTKQQSIKIYEQLLRNYAGLTEYAFDEAKNKVVSGVELKENQFLIKTKSAFNETIFESFSLTSKNQIKNYKSLVKKGSKFYLWTDDNKTCGITPYTVPSLELT